MTDVLQEMWADLKSAIQGSEARLGQRIDGLERRMGGVEQRIDALEQRVDVIGRELSAVRQELGQVSMQAVTAMLDMAKTNQELVREVRERRYALEADVVAIKAHLGLK